MVFMQVLGGLVFLLITLAGIYTAGKLVYKVLTHRKESHSETVVGTGNDRSEKHAD